MKKLKNKMKYFKILLASSLLGFGVHQAQGQEVFDITTHIKDFYEVYKIDPMQADFQRVLSDLNNFEDTKTRLEIRNIVDYVDYCFEQNEDYKVACITTLSHAGQYDSLRGLAEYFYEKAENTEDPNITTKYLIFAATQFGMAEGLKDLELLNNAPYRSFRMTFQDLRESDLIAQYEDSQFINEFYNFGIYDSVDYQLTPLFGYNNQLLAEDMAIEIDLDEETKGLIQEGDFIDIFNELRELINNEEGINYLIRKAANEEYEDIFVSLLRGTNGFPEERHVSVYTLFDQGIHKNNDLALYYLIQENYRLHVLNREDAGYDNAYLDDVLKFSAILHNRNPYFNNEIFDLLLANSENHIDFIQNFNKIRKNYIKP